MELNNLYNDAIKSGSSSFWVKGGSFDSQNGTTTAEGYTTVAVGNNKSVGTAGNSTGILRLFSDSGYRADLYSTTTSNINIALPDKNGMLALLTDIPNKIHDIYKGTNLQLSHLAIFLVVVVTHL